MDSEPILEPMTFGRYLSIMHNFLPVMEALEEDEELHGLAKDLMDKLVERLNQS